MFAAVQGQDGYDEFDEFDDLGLEHFDEEETYTQPPHGDDRLWRHPSEMRQVSPTAAGSDDPTNSQPVPFAPDFVPEPFVELIPTGEQLVLVPNEAVVESGRGRRRSFALASTALLSLLVLGGMQLQSARDPVPSASVASTPTPDPDQRLSEWTSREPITPNHTESETAADRGEHRILDRSAPSSTASGFEFPARWTEQLRERLVGVVSGLEVVVNGTTVPGYGIVFDDDGHVVTSARLVDNASHVIVHVDDLRHVARVVGVDMKTDVAVLHLDQALAPARLNPTTEQWSGRYVLAPNAGTAMLTTTQILHRDGQAIWGEGDQIFGLFQLDMNASELAPGAPVIDDLGQIVAMGVFGSNPDATAEGEPVAFAVPAVVIDRVATGLIANGFAQHPWLGVEVSDTSSGAPRGAEIATVLFGSPAASLGLQPGDVIVSFNGQSVTSMGDLVSAIQHRSPGDPVTLSWLRDGMAQHGATELSTDQD